MRFTSKHAAQQVPVREAVMDYANNPNGRQVRPALWVDFAEDAWTESYEAEGLGVYEAPAGGGYFDTEAAQRRHSWTDEERLAVEEKLLWLSDNAPGREGQPLDREARAAGVGDVHLHLPVVPTPPWSTYDTMHHNTIVQRAIELGLVDAVIVYEERTKRRDGILAPLREKVQGEQNLQVA